MRGLVDVLNPFFPLKEGRWLILAFTFTSNIWCQQEQDSTIVSYSDKIALGLDMSTDIDEFIVNSPNVSNFHLVSNNDLKLTLKLNYKFLSLSAGKKMTESKQMPACGSGAGPGRSAEV